MSTQLHAKVFISYDKVFTSVNKSIHNVAQNSIPTKKIKRKKATDCDVQ